MTRLDSDYAPSTPIEEVPNGNDDDNDDVGDVAGGDVPYQHQDAPSRPSKRRRIDDDILTSFLPSSPLPLSPPLSFLFFSFTSLSIIFFFDTHYICRLYRVCVPRSSINVRWRCVAKSLKGRQILIGVSNSLPSPSHI